MVNFIKKIDIFELIKNLMMPENEAFIFKRDKELQKEISILTELLGDKKRIKS